MRVFFLTSLALLGTASASAIPLAKSSDPVRILPSWWGFNIIGLKGPGCPSNGPDTGYKTRETFGLNTVDGSEIYYWHFAYPHIKASVGGDEDEANVWCETTLNYTEWKDAKNTVTAADYRLKLHKNGTEVIANYDLDEGVEAKWKFTYYTTDDDEVVDTISVNGPYKSKYEDDMQKSPVPKNPERWALPQCGTGIIKYKTELSLKAKKRGGKGTVASPTLTVDGKPSYYGVQPGISYDFEKCKK